MKLHNTLTKKVETFTPIKKDHATIYSCGPTVYDHIHIGNLRAFIMADTLSRSLQASGYKVQQVMNFTDVDDKTISRSAQTCPDESPEVALSKLTRHYEDIFLEDMAAIGNDTKALQFVRATDSIGDMQTLIAELYAAKIAYITDDGVYFSIKAYREQGKTYGQLLELSTSNTSEARIDNDEYDKESVHDFALWKTQKGDEPAWDFELDGHNLLGRPGWHIECSAMSSANLGQPFDIHTGGIDLVFPHHENEIAQSTATTDAGYANYFVHNEHLLVDGRKMAKSANNFFTLRDIQEKGFAPEAFRILALQAHYRSQLNFSWDNLEAAQNRLAGYQAMADRRWQAGDSAINDELLQNTKTAIIEALQDDLNTPLALERLSQLENAINEHGISRDDQPVFVELLEWLDLSLGLNLSNRADITPEQKAQLAARQKAREAKDWAQTDAIRDALKAEGINVRDTATGQVWSRQA